MRLRAALVLAALPVATNAQPAPLVQPNRDVTVRYVITGEATSLLPGGLPGPATLSWDAARQRLRAEAEGRNQVAVVDLRTHTGQVYDTSLRVVLPLKLRPGALGLLTSDAARLQPRGRDTVAGLPCTDYTVDGRTPGMVCLTADGVPLRGSGSIEGKPGSFTALSVIYGPVPPDRFTPPPGYMSLSGADTLDLRSLRGLLGLGAR